MRKLLSLILSIMMLVSVLTVPALADEREITVLLNGKKLEFDVPPMLVNDRTMVPMRAIFEALNATVFWNDYTETVVGVGALGNRIVATIGSKVATIDDKPVEIDSPPALIDGRTLFPLRFISEALSCKVDWDDATYTVSITSSATEKSNILFIDSSSYETIGRWTDKGNHLLHGIESTTPPASDEDDARASFSVSETGKYRVWVLANDYATNQQGSRFFNVSINGTSLEKTFGQHGKDGFHWEDGGVVELEVGKLNELRVIDTSGFYARLKGIIITSDLDMVPQGEFEQYKDSVVQNMATCYFVPYAYPNWATEKRDDEQIETIENDSFKINFYKGTADRGGIVQNEIFMKRGGEWVLVKDRSEELGILGMYAKESVPRIGRHTETQVADAPLEVFSQKFETLLGEYQNSSVKNFYHSGKAEWLIPKSITKIDDKTVSMAVSSENVDGTMTFSFDDLTPEPKVTFSANLKTDGAYSFTYFSGDDFDEDSFTKVTAPLHYIQKTIPSDGGVIGESGMFTPMIAYTFDNDGKEFTKGLAVDPTSVRQYTARPGDQDFGMVFRSQNGYPRAQLVAPLFGTTQCNFKANDYYSFSYRLLYNDLGGYETMKHVAEDMFNCTDIRENYYSSLNEAIYNMTDLLMNDTYAAWDPDKMGFWYMESATTVSQSDVLELVQRYLMTEDKEFLEKRVIPSISFLMTRGGNSYDHDVNLTTPRQLGNSVNFTASTYIGMYLASQGRTPYLLNEALSKYNTFLNTKGPVNVQALNLALDTDKYNPDMQMTADQVLDQIYSDEFDAVADFVHDATNENLNFLIKAYEETGEQKYLDGAKLVGEYIMQEIWTTGYQNDYATAEYTVDPDYFDTLDCINDEAGFIGWWLNGVKWRVGNPPGVFTAVEDCENRVKEESAPGWVSARTGEGTEHPLSTSMGRSIYINTWAGSMLRLAKYTGDDFFRTQARNAIIGKFANYPGYYHERLSLHDKQENFPYEGPDYNFIFWHQIPAHLAMTEDFLINDFWDRSDMNIDFPGVVNSGYAYFDINQYGFVPGKFYDEEDMWLWIDRGIVEPDTNKVNYLPARKDGTLGVSFINTTAEELTTTVTLGEKIPNASSFNEKATLLDKDGNKSTVDIVNGKFTITIPAKGIASVVMHPDVKKPSWVKDYEVSNSLGNTVSAFDSGKAILLQFNDDEYYAYMYSNKYASELKSVTFNYKFAGQSYIKTDDVYPFETIVKVPLISGISRDFSYSVTGIDKSGKTVNLGSGELTPLTKEQVLPFDGNVQDQPVYSTVEAFAPIHTNVNTLAVSSGKIRISIPNEDLSKLGTIEKGSLKGYKVKGVFTSKLNGEKHLLDRVITDNEIGKASTVIVVEPYGRLTKTNATSSNYTVDDFVILPPNYDTNSYKLKGEDEALKDVIIKERLKLPEFEPFNPKPTSCGKSGNNWRITVPYTQIPFEIDENILTGVKVTIKATEADSGETKVYETVVSANEIGPVSTTVVMTIPAEVPAGKYNLFDDNVYSSCEITFTYVGKNY